MVKVLGIGGGAGTGKTTVASFFQKRGIAVLELDELSRQLAQKGKPIWRVIIKTWGRFFLDQRGNIDRLKLRKVVFRNAAILFLLNQLTHPILLQATRKWLSQRRNNRVVVIEGAILFEGGFLPLLDEVIFVETELPIRKKRLIDKGWKREDVDNLIETQRFLKCLQRRAQFTIVNQDSKEKLWQDIGHFWRIFHIQRK